MDSRVYEGITEDIWTCVKQTSINEDHTKYDPPDANKGKATTKKDLVTVVMLFDFDPTAQTLKYGIEKHGIAPKSAIWNGITEMIKGCGGSGNYTEH